MCVVCLFCLIRIRVGMLFPKSSTFPPRGFPSTAPHHNRPPALQSIRNLLPVAYRILLFSSSAATFKVKQQNKHKSPSRLGKKQVCQSELVSKSAVLPGSAHHPSQQTRRYRNQQGISAGRKVQSLKCPTTPLFSVDFARERSCEKEGKMLMSTVNLSN